MFDSELSITAVGPHTWATLAPLTWVGHRIDPATGEPQVFTVPAKFTTDFATVPRFLHWLWLPYGAYTRAAVLHDWLITILADEDARTAWRGGRGDKADYLTPPITSRDVDGIFRAAMRDLGVGWLKRWTGWAAVRAASLFSPHRAYGREFGKDAWRVILIAVTCGPVIAIGAIPVLFVLGIVRFATWVTGGPPPVRLSRRARLARQKKGNTHA